MNETPNVTVGTAFASSSAHPTRRVSDDAGKNDDPAEAEDNINTDLLYKSSQDDDDTQQIGTACVPFVEEMDDDDDDSDSPKNIRCSAVYNKKINDKRVLMAMAIGLKGCNCDLEKEPFVSSTGKKRLFTPTNKELDNEIMRRAKDTSITGINKMPKPKGWTTKKRMEFLVKHPVTNQDDIDFLIDETTRYKGLLELAIAETQQQNARRDRADTWSKMEVYLRFYHALVHDQVRDLYFNMHRVMTKTEIDSRAVSPKEAFYKKTAEIFNDPNWNPMSNVYQDLHEQFHISYSLSHSKVRVEVTADKIKEKFADVRAKLVMIHDNYHKSGNGIGNNKLSNANDNGTKYGNDDKADFLGNNSPHILYFWQLMEEHQMLQNTLSVIPDGVRADAESVPATVNTPRNKRKANNNEDDSSTRNNDFQKCMADYTFANMYKVLHEAKQKSKEYFDSSQEKYYKEEDGPYKDLLKKRMDEAQASYTEDLNKFNNFIKSRSLDEM